MSESFEKAVEAGAEALAGQHWRTAMDDARAALRAALPHLTAQDVPHVARVAWEMGRAMGLADHSGSIMAGRLIRTPNPYAEEATDDHA